LLKFDVVGFYQMNGECNSEINCKNMIEFAFI